MMDLEIIAALLGGSNIKGQVRGVTIDSRTVKPGELFIALRGERFDGHDFIEQAAHQGAVAVICEHPATGLAIPQITVKDSLAALASLAAHHRQSIHCPVIALTGSNGKTSVKEMIAAILPQPSHATPGNFNNHIGAPLSVLQLTPQHRYAVFELGASHIGEIAYTVALVKPQIALINNIAPAHIEGFGSIDGVARAKGEIYEGLPPDGTAVVNNDDNYAHFWDEIIATKNVLRFGLHKAQDVTAENLIFDEHGCAQFTLILPQGREKINLQTPGEHSVRNALAAASCCYAAGIASNEIAAGLERFTGVKGRMCYQQGINGSVIIDDSYNANLRSVLAAIEVLAKRAGKRILVLGDMGELGAWTQEHHEEIGRVAMKKGIDSVVTCGNHSKYTSAAFGDKGRHYSQQSALINDLLPQLDAETTVLVKGSRSAAMENVVKALLT